MTSSGNIFLLWISLFLLGIAVLINYWHPIARYFKTEKTKAKELVYEEDFIP